MIAFAFSEKPLSQIPALQLLDSLGCEYVPPERALRLRGGRLGDVILDESLREQLKRINRIAYESGECRFGRENVQSAIQQIGRSLDKKPSEWEYDDYPYAGRPAVHQESLSARSIAQAGRLSAVVGPRA